MKNGFIENLLFSSLTTLRIGGPIKYFCPAFSEEEIFHLIATAEGGVPLRGKMAKDKNLPYLVISGGSNLLVADEGFDGLVIQNLASSIKKSDDVLEVASGTDLQELVWWSNKRGWSGFEKLAGIPGSVGGAVYGNAGAYGQVISDNIIWVNVLDPQSSEIKKLRKEECDFSYRESRFKKTKEVILNIGFSIAWEDPKKLEQTSHEIVSKRQEKYPPGIACPGSFFKNVEVDKLEKKVLEKVSPGRILFGKIPAGWLIEEVGGKGMVKGDVEIASWHGNLFVNRGRGKAADFLYLAKICWQKVKEKFDIMLEPEVQMIGFKDEIFTK